MSVTLDRNDRDLKKKLRMLGMSITLTNEQVNSSVSLSSRFTIVTTGTAGYQCWDTSTDKVKCVPPTSKYCAVGRCWRARRLILMARLPPQSGAVSLFTEEPLPKL